MRYAPATDARCSPSAKSPGSALHRPVSTMRPPDREEAARRQAEELDVWEAEGGTIGGHVPELSRHHARRQSDDFSD
jgi:hypothetical protein